MKVKRTPGPWYVSDAESDIEGLEQYGYRVHHKSNTVADGIHNAADARLIAAAPKLLACLKRERAECHSESCDDKSTHCPRCMAYDEIIAEAEIT